VGTGVGTEGILVWASGAVFLVLFLPSGLLCGQILAFSESESPPLEQEERTRRAQGLLCFSCKIS
jgi:hypothetical protein